MITEGNLELQEGRNHSVMGANRVKIIEYPSLHELFKKICLKVETKIISSDVVLNV